MVRVPRQIFDGPSTLSTTCQDHPERQRRHLDMIFVLPKLARVQDNGQQIPDRQAPSSLIGSNFTVGNPNAKDDLAPV